MDLRLPDVLVVGAQKSGTQTLFNDLAGVTGLHLPPFSKESSFLVRRPVGRRVDRIRYAWMFRAGAATQLGVDVSTRYAMQPRHEGVAEAARRLFPDPPRILYILRHPLDRSLSHHHHDVLLGRTSLSAAEAIQPGQPYVDYSRYAWQLEPWLDYVGSESVHLIRFEDYVADRTAGVEAVCRFLGVLPARSTAIDQDAVYNRTGERIAPRGWPGRLVRHPLWTRYGRRLVPADVRQRAKSRVSDPAPPRPTKPSHEAVADAVEVLADDVDRLRALHSRAPKWDLSCW
ncbi:MAG: sulfotransferase family protein [Acidimicrobiales bacterium]